MNQSMEHSRAGFNQNGYVCLRGVLDTSTWLEIGQRLENFIQTTIPKLPSEHVFYEKKDDHETLKQIQHLEEHDPWFCALFKEGPFRSLAAELLGGDCKPVNMQYFNKPPHSSKPTPPHQDGHYFMLKPCEAVTMWLALDHVNEKNGCIRYLRGSNHLGLLPHGKTTTLGFSQGISDYAKHCDVTAEVPIHASPGDLLAHHALTVHRADANHSADRQRRAIGFIYYSASAKHDEVAHKAYQKQLKQEMIAANRI